MPCILVDVVDDVVDDVVGDAVVDVVVDIKDSGTDSVGTSAPASVLLVVVAAVLMGCSIVSISLLAWRLVLLDMRENSTPKKDQQHNNQGVRGRCNYFCNHNHGITKPVNQEVQRGINKR